MFDRDARNYIKQIVQQLPTRNSTNSPSSLVGSENPPISGANRRQDLFYTFFDVQSSGDCSESDVSIAHQRAKQIDVELEKYEAIRTPTTTQLKFWKTAISLNSFPILRQTARFLLAVKTSSATIERVRTTLQQCRSHTLETPPVHETR